jgi:hypothetical protein
MTWFLTLFLKWMFFTSVTLVGLLYFGLIGLAPVGWWIWCRQLEVRHG